MKGLKAYDLVMYVIITYLFLLFQHFISFQRSYVAIYIYYHVYVLQTFTASAKFFLKLDNGGD